MAKKAVENVGVDSDNNKWLHHQFQGGIYEERSAWLRHFDRLKKQGIKVVTLDSIYEFNEKRKKLCDKKMGGAGRK